MWLSSDGRVNTRARPDDEWTRPLIARLIAMTADHLEQLDTDLEALQWKIADELDLIPFDAKSEEPFVASPIPLDVLKAVDWDEAVGAEKEAEFNRVDLRWRLDVLGIVQQAIVDLSSKRG